MDTAKQTIFPKEEYILNDINSENHFETNVWNIDDRYYSSKWHITDHYTSVIILKDIEDFESIPFCNEDPECKRMANVLLICLWAWILTFLQQNHYLILTKRIKFTGGTNSSIKRIKSFIIILCSDGYCRK